MVLSDFLLTFTFDTVSAYAVVNPESGTIRVAVATPNAAKRVKYDALLNFINTLSFNEILIKYFSQA
ncbi:Uncharacterised protein [Chlamydia trachomatis]|nr:Uncharacterised protein [Chlamydia trachomatis]